MFAHPLCGDGNFSERKRQVFQLPVPSWETAECSKDLILWLVLTPFLWEKYYTRKEVTCEYNILVDILYVWKDEDSWTQVESDIQILALPGKEMRWYLHILFGRLREWCRYGIKKIQPRALSCIFFSWLSLRITQLSNDDRIQHELSRVLLPLRITQLSNRVMTKIKHTFSKPFIDEYHRVHKLKIATTKQQWLTFKCILPSRITQLSNYQLYALAYFHVLLPLRITQFSNRLWGRRGGSSVLLPLRTTQLSNPHRSALSTEWVLLPLRITQLSNAKCRL